ncbi:hypothetical protein HDZ31DRAFT_80366 [Schizophyllum fasciatum]
MAPLTSRLSFPSLSAARKHNQPAPLVISAPQKLRATAPASCRKRGRENECPAEAEDANPRTRRRTTSIWNGVVRKRRQVPPAPAQDAPEPRRSLATTLFGDTPSVRLRKSSAASSRRAPPAVRAPSREPSYASMAARPRAPTPGAVAASALPGPRGSGAKSIFRRIRKSLTRSRGSSLCTGSSAGGGDSGSEHFSEWVLSSEGRGSCSPPPVPPKPEWATAQPRASGLCHPQRLSSRAGHSIAHLAASLDSDALEEDGMQPVSDEDDDSDDGSSDDDDSTGDGCSVLDYGKIIRDGKGLLRLGASDLSLEVVLLGTSVVDEALNTGRYISCQLGLHVTVADWERWHSSALAAPNISLLDIRLSCQPTPAPSPCAHRSIRRWLCQPAGSRGELRDCCGQPGLAVGADWTRTVCDARTLPNTRAAGSRGWLRTVAVDVPARWLASREAGTVDASVCVWLGDEAADFLRGTIALDAAELRRRVRAGDGRRAY